MPRYYRFYRRYYPARRTFSRQRWGTARRATSIGRGTWSARRSSAFQRSRRPFHGDILRRLWAQEQTTSLTAASRTVPTVQFSNGDSTPQRNVPERTLAVPSVQSTRARQHGSSATNPRPPQPTSSTTAASTSTEQPSTSRPLKPVDGTEPGNA